MNKMDIQERNAQKEILLSNPELLKTKKPFAREYEDVSSCSEKELGLTESAPARLPKVKRKTISQDQFILELEPKSHNIYYDENIPSICVKLNNGRIRDIQFRRTAIPFQRIIKDKQVLHLTGNPLQFTLMETEPSEKTNANFIKLKQHWELRNQDGMIRKMVDTQKSYGDAGLLYYYDYNSHIKSRVISYADGYVICSHNDDNGDRMLESIYYCQDGVEYIDSYDDTFMYRHEKKPVESSNDEDGWTMTLKREHGFNEIPLVTKRGNVAWNDVQDLIETYEIIFNVFNAIQKRFGWGVLYIKGKFGDKGQKLAGNIILNDQSVEGNGDAKFLTPPTPANTIETLEQLEEAIQKGSSTTFILPKDIRLSGDISGVAIQLTQSLDIEKSLQEKIEWQNVVDKCVRLFTYGLANELVNNNEDKTAITDFADMKVHAEFKIWIPRNDYEYNQMITILKGANVLSRESAIELNTLSKPDEKKRVSQEDEKENDTEGTVVTGFSANQTNVTNG